MRRKSVRLPASTMVVPVISAGLRDNQPRLRPPGSADNRRQLSKGTIDRKFVLCPAPASGRHPEMAL